jgi:hypothetical protein
MVIKKNAIPKIKQYVLFVFSLIVLILGFYLNTWNTISNKKFKNFDKFSESLVIGRLIMAENKGFLSYGALTGFAKDRPKGEHYVDYQYKIYKEEIQGINTNKYWVYKSQIGGQASLFAFIDRYSPYNNSTNLDFFYFLSSILAALSFTFFVIWIQKNYGFDVAILSLVLIIITEWINIFGNNLWWQLWSYYFPFLVFLFLLDKETKNKDNILIFRKILFFSFITVLVKCFFSGMEYMSATLIMLCIPFVYYSILNRHKFTKFFKRIMAVVLGSVSAIAVNFFVLSYQIAQVEGSMSKGLEHIVMSFLKRSSGDSSNFDEAFRESLDSSVFDVLEKYWNGVALDFTAWFTSDWESFLKVDFGELFLIVLIFTSVIYISKDILPSLYSARKSNHALVLTTWLSMAAPLSWFIIFKGHSYIHTHLNFITWYMPFVLLAYVIISVVINAVIKDYVCKIKFRNLNKWIKNTISTQKS